MPAAGLSDNARGALIMTASMAAFTFNDACVKAVSGDMPLFQLLMLRGMATTILICGLAWYMGALRWRFGARDWSLIAVRSLAEVGAAFFFITALRHMPIANITAILQVLPLTMTLGVALFFKEPVGWRRMVAILVGFCGVLLIVRPGPEGFDVNAGYALMAVGFVTLRDLVTRRMSSAAPSMMITLSASVGVLIFSAVATTGETWVAVGVRDAGLILGASVLIFGGYLFSVMVMRVGEMSFIAPFRYSGLLWALVLGWIAFGHWPEPLTLLGSAIVVATGVFTFYREGRVARRARLRS